MSNKKIDENGFRTYKNCKFFCERVSQYLGREIDPDGSQFGLDPEKIYNVYRPLSEVSKQEFVESLNAKPLLDDHTIIGDFGENPDNIKEIGVLTEVRVDGSDLIGRIDIWSPEALKKIDAGKVELSLAYQSVYKPQKGVFNGQRYDFVQSELSCGNHLALVDVARNGHDCCITDGIWTRDEHIKLEKPTVKDMKDMSADELIEGLKGCSDEVRAKAKDFLNTPTPEEKEAADKAAKEAEEKAKKEAEEKEAADKAAAEQAAKDAEEKAKKDEEEKQAAIKDACKAATDAAVKNLQAAYKLANDAAPKYGQISMDGIMTEADVAKKICSLDTGKALAQYAGTPDIAIAIIKHELNNKVVSTDSATAKTQTGLVEFDPSML